MTTTAVRVNVLDLTVDQVETIERDVGLPLDKWQTAPSQIAVLRRIYAAATGTSDEAVGRMTMRELTDSVMLDDEDTPANPTPRPRRTASRTSP